MPSKQVLVVLTPEEWCLLQRVAAEEERAIDQQARYLLKRVLLDLASDRPGTEPEEEAGHAT